MSAWRRCWCFPSPSTPRRIRSGRARPFSRSPTRCRSICCYWIYWWHRANHELPILWRFHEVHHRDAFLDATSALRFHFGEVVIAAVARAMVIFLLAIPLGSVLIFETLVLVAAIFHHSNARLPEALEQRLARWIITPSLHWVHHHK